MSYPAESCRYAAFISYRHVEPDRQWAVWLHGAIERYRVPRSARRELGLPSGVGRVFRDEDEVSASSDLNAEIEKALEESRFLIVICSPRAPDSKWVNREIERFREMGRGERILALLVEGEPKDAFPPALRAIRSVAAPGAPAVGVLEEIEPLAADIRASRLGSPRQVRRTAELRLVSTVLGCRFDDLRRRDLERRQRIVITAAVLALALAAALGALALFAFRQRDARQIALTREAAALSAKTAALEDYERLGDLSRLKQLNDGYLALWPAEPALVPRLQAWMSAAREMRDHLPGHRAALARMRSSAGVLPYMEQDREADRNAHPHEQTEIELHAADIRRRLDEIEELEENAESRSASNSKRVATLRLQVEELRTWTQRAETRRNERLTWRFSTFAEQFKHDTTNELVEGLTRFVDPTLGPIGAMEDRLAFSQTVVARTIEGYATEWNEAIRSIADPASCPAYRGLAINPQLGLVPIGRDPASGLWEFIHLQTCDRSNEKDPRPRRDRSGRLEVTEDMGIVFVLLPGGTFSMGAVRPDEDHDKKDPNVDPKAEAEERPIVRVTLDPFFMSKYEVTQGQWRRIMRGNPSENWPSPVRILNGRVMPTSKPVTLCNPVEHVSWTDCDRCVRCLNFELPTEAQWEYAARGGTTTPRWFEPTREAFAKSANLADAALREEDSKINRSFEPWNDGYGRDAPVGRYEPNPFGLHDMFGNVQEWCRDWWRKANLPDPAPGDGLRDEPGGGIRKVIRGAGWNSASLSARASARTSGKTDSFGPDLGLRPVRRVFH